MKEEILSQLGRIAVESDSAGVLSKLAAIVCNTLLAIWIYLGTINESFLRVFDPATWTLQDYASFASLLAALMYFIKNFSDWRYAKRKQKREQLKAEAANDGTDY